MILASRSQLDAMRSRLDDAGRLTFDSKIRQRGDDLFELNGDEYFALLTAHRKIQERQRITPVIGADAEKINKSVQGADLESGMKGLGDLIGKVATPIARVIGMDCIDKSTGELKPLSPCAQRKAKYNALIPFKRP